MKNFKDITLSIFAIIGFIAILSSFNNQTAQSNNNANRFEYIGKEFNQSYVIDKQTGAIYSAKTSNYNESWSQRAEPIEIR